MSTNVDNLVFVHYRGLMEEPKYDIEQTDSFSKWLRKLKDLNAKARILKRLQKIAMDGDFGDRESVGDGVSELRFHFGPGYRVYYTLEGSKLIILLAGGSKQTQERDIAKAKDMLK